MIKEPEIKELKEYLKGIDELSKKVTNFINYYDNLNKIKWKGSKVQATFLIYSLIESGLIESEQIAFLKVLLPNWNPQNFFVLKSKMKNDIDYKEDMNLEEVLQLMLKIGIEDEDLRPYQSNKQMIHNFETNKKTNRN